MKNTSLPARIFSGFLMFSFLLVTNCSNRLLNSSRDPAATGPSTQPSDAGPPLPLDLVGDLQNFATDISGPDGKSGLLKVVGDSIMAQTKKTGTRKYLTDGDMQQVLKRARNIRVRVEGILNDTKTKDEAKFILLQAYIAKVVGPERQLVTLLWTQADTDQGNRSPVNDLLFPISRRLIPKGSKLEDAVATAMNGVGASGVLVHDVKGRADVGQMALDPMTGLQMDVQALSFAQTKDNYVRAMKLLTIQMILSQQQLYNVISGSSSSISIPQGCREKLSAGLPEALDIPEISNEDRQQVVDSFLINNGIIGGTSQYREHFLDNVRADPTSGGFSGYVPFERYHAARYGLDENRSEAMEPGIDDISDYEAVVSLKAPAIMDKTVDRPATLYGKTTTAREIVGQLLSPEEEDWTRGEGDEQTTIQTSGMSKLLVNQMKAQNIINWQELVPAGLQDQLKANVLQLEMPPLDGPDSWTRWGLYEMSNAIRIFKDTGNQDVLAKVGAACPRVVQGRGSSAADPKQCMQRLWSVLAPFQAEGDEQMLPKTAYESPQLRALYPGLRQLWNSFRDMKILRAAKVSEWEYLSYQMGNNPWASLRLAYLLASQNSADAGKANWRGAKPDIFAGVKKELQLDKPLYPFVGNRILSKKEKKAIWEYMVEQNDSQNASLLGTHTSPSPLSADAYAKMTDLSRMTVLDHNSAQQAIKTLGFPVTDRIKQKWNAVWARPESRASEKLLEIYKAKGDVAKQEQLYEKFSDEYGWSDQYDVKAAMLDLDTSLKSPVYESILSRSAILRKADLAQPLNELCKLNLNGDLNNYKALYFRTVKAQDQVNQAFGLKGVPKDVMKEAEKWSKQDWNNLWLGLIQGVLWIGVTVFAAGCTVVTAGLCLPIALTLAVAATATQVYIYKTTVDAAIADGQKKSALKMYADLGLTDNASVKKVQAHHYWEIGLEAAFTFPLLGSVAKTGELTTRAGVTAVKRLAMKIGGAAAEDLPAVKTVVREVEVGVSKYVLGITSKREAASFLGHYARMFLLDPASKRVWEKIGQAVFREEIVRETPREIDHAFARTIADFFGNNPRKMLNIVGRYTGRKLARLSAREIKLGAKLAANEDDLNFLQKFWRGLVTKWRYNRLSTKVVAMERLKAMVPELESLKAANKPLDEFVEKYADDLGEIIHDLPPLYRELPYMNTMFGSPMMFEKTALMQQLAGSLALKRIAVARDNLLYHLVLNEALDKLGIKESLAVHNTFDVFDAFRRMVTNLPDDKAVPELTALMDKLADSMAKYQVEKMGGSITKASVLEIFGSTEPADREASRILWETTPSNLLFSADGFKGPAAAALKQFANYSEVDGFQNFLNALKIAMLSKKQIVPPVHGVN